MQLGKSLVGAIVGAAVGIALLFVVYLTLGLDKVWLSIPFAFVTGLGVRMFVSTAGHASYVRGALTMLITLAAYIGGWLLVAQYATARANAPGKAPASAKEQPVTEPGDATAKDGETTDEAKDQTDATKDENKDAATAPKTTLAPAPQPKKEARKTVSDMPRMSPTTGMAYTPGDIICLAIAALVAYELGRGSGIAAAGNQPPVGAPAGTHPDA